MMKVSMLAATLPAAAVAQKAGFFSYDPLNDFGPQSWAAVDMPGNQCGGAQQSGIDVPTTPCDMYDDYVFAAGSCTLDDLEFILFPHAIQANYNTASGCQPPRMKIPGQILPFDAVQFHMHTGTDHAIDDTYFGADMHLVHKEQGGDRFAVLGYFLEPTNPTNVPKFSDLLDEFEAVEAAVYNGCGIDTAVSILGDGRRERDRQRKLAGLKKAGKVVKAEESSAQQSRKLPRSFNPYDLMPKGATIYTYDGSLTTPPCSEVVFWNVVDLPVSISVREFLRLTNLILDYVDPATCELATNAAPSGFTGRPVQAINGREITRICPSDFPREAEPEVPMPEPEADEPEAPMDEPEDEPEPEEPKEPSQDEPDVADSTSDNPDSSATALSAVSGLLAILATLLL